MKAQQIILVILLSTCFAFYPASATEIVLNFDSLPSSQGFSYAAGGSGAGFSEQHVAEVDCTKLTFNTMGLPLGSGGSNQFRIFNVVGQSDSYSLDWRIRVILDEGSASNNHFGFFVSVGSGLHRITVGMSTQKIVVVTSGGTEITTNHDNTSFQNFKIVARPGIGWDLLIDGTIVHQDLTFASSNTDSLDFGDGTGFQNVRVEISNLRFHQGAIPQTEVVSSHPFHSPYSGSGTPPGNRVDFSKTLVKECSKGQLLTYDNLINTAQGINGIVFDIENLPVAGNLSTEDFQFQVSPQGAFDIGANPPTNWPSAPAPSSITVTPGSPDRVLIQWPDQSIMNRWLRITVLATEETGLAEPEVYYIGHMLGETTGPTDGVFTVSFADITPIRAEVGQTVDASSATDVDKNGTVSFADISAMRGNVGSQLRQISVP